MKKQSVMQKILRVTSVFLMGAALVTLAPIATSGEACIFGYAAVCPFAPISTVVLFYSGLLIHRFLEEKHG